MLGTGIRPTTAQRRPVDKPVASVGAAKPVAVFEDKVRQARGSDGLQPYTARKLDRYL